LAELISAAKQDGFPETLFVHRASVEVADKFFANRAAHARVITDPDGALFAAFGLRRGTLLQVVGPAVWWRGLVALCKGNLVGKPTGNEMQMPGAFLVHGRQVLWQHRARHSADHPRLAAMLDTLTA
jgi:hypothetical protein